MQGKIIFEGPSLIDGAPIVAIALQSIYNQKTGPAIQSYILRSDMSPIEAIKSRDDFSICGNCIHRGASYKSRSCYVLVFQAPMQVYRSYKAGRYGKGVAPVSKWPSGLLVRLGSYGDPAAVPREVWDNLIKRGTGHVGYTHSPYIQDLRDLVQASADTEYQATELQAQGWKTFRTRRPGEHLMKSEAQCPASVESGKATTCSACKLCDGTKRNVSIEIHGAHHLRRNFVLNLEGL